MEQGTVERWLIIAQKRDRRIDNPGEERPLAWIEEYVTNADHRAALKLWVWCKANGYAYSAICKSRGFSVTTWERWRRLALERITMQLSLRAALMEHSNLVATAV